MSVIKTTLTDLKYKKTFAAPVPASVPRAPIKVMTRMLKTATLVVLPPASTLLRIILVELLGQGQ